MNKTFEAKMDGDSWGVSFVITNDELAKIYLEDGESVLVNTGEIHTSNFDSSRLAELIICAKEDKLLLNGSIYGKTLPIIKVEQSDIDNLLNALHENDDSAQYDEHDTDVSKTLTRVMQQTVDYKGSDIHIELYEKRTKIFARVDGRRVLLGKVVESHVYGDELFSYIFTARATEKDGSYVAKNVNNGHLQQVLFVDGTRRMTRWRVSYIPAKRGGKVTMRWLDESTEIPPLESLGFRPAHLSMIRRYLKMPSGCFLVSGKTGSGKTTTIAAALNEIDPSRSVHTLEDPPEFDFDFMQTPVAPREPVSEGSSEMRGFNYYSTVLLRHDIDAELHGEVRGHEGAMELCRKGETGQLIFASLHTSSATGICHTFIEQFHVPRAVIAAEGLMRLWVCQTLVRMLCPHCKLTSSEADEAYANHPEHEDYMAAKKILKTRGIESAYHKNPQGCDKCIKGERGRTVVAEMIVFDEVDRRFIAVGDYEGWHNSLKERGYQTMVEHAFEKIEHGLIDIRTTSEKVSDLIPVDVSSVYRPSVSHAKKPLLLPNK